MIPRKSDSIIDDLMAIRKTKGLDRIVVAKRIGITVSRLVDLEKGDIDPTLGEVRRYANALGVSVQYRIVAS